MRSAPNWAVQEAYLGARGLGPNSHVPRVLQLIDGLGPEALDVLEVSAGERFSNQFRFRSFTPTRFGMRYLLEECGFASDSIQTASWGNRACVKSNLYRWSKTGWLGSLKNEPDYPVAIWALARK